MYKIISIILSLKLKVRFNSLLSLGNNKRILNFLKNKDAVTAIEYALLGFLVSIAIIIGVTALSTRLFDRILPAWSHNTSDW